MDGNSRWASLMNLPRSEGHKKGAQVVKTLIPVALKHEIKYLSLYAFSSENWGRSKQEVSFLFNLFWEYLRKESGTLKKHGVHLKVIGNFDKLPLRLKLLIKKIQNIQCTNHKMTLCLAISYGGRDEIIQACQKMIQLKVENINQENFKKFLYDPEMPDVDLFIRTSGTQRISNFLIWHGAYSEIYFSPKYWPDFEENDLIEAIKYFNGVKRTFGIRHATEESLNIFPA
jgi:undecaprenyl diphosphate synthase